MRGPGAGAYPPAMRILLAEDDAAIAAAVKSSLQQGGHAVDHVSDGNSADHALRDHDYDLLVLDLGLPLLDGSDVLARARKRGSGVPVLVVTAREGLKERVRVLDLGADDYLVKPVDFEELAARIHAVARRSAGRNEASEPGLAFADIVFDPRNRQTIVNGRPVELRPREAALLEALLRRAGEPVHREALLSRVWPDHTYVTPRSVDTLVKRLRRRVEIQPAEPALVLTIWGSGYKFADV